MTPDEISAATKALQHDNLHKDFRALYTPEQWSKYTERDKCALYIGFTQGCLVFGRVTELKSQSMQLLLTLSMVVMESNIKLLQSYLETLQDTEVSEAKFIITGNTTQATFGKN